MGALYQAFEQLKKKLAAEGLFDRNQRPLPLFPKRVAVVTSQSGAVIQDIMTTVARRYPILQLTLFPAVVQGDQAADSLVKRLNQIKTIGGFDAVIIGRGGGSIEDLWPFNEEKLRAHWSTCRCRLSAQWGMKPIQPLPILLPIDGRQRQLRRRKL